MLPKQTVVSPSGIITQPNEYGELPPGTLLQGDGIRIRRKGVIEPRPALAYYVINNDSAATYKAWPIYYVGGFNGVSNPSDRLIFVDQEGGSTKSANATRLRMFETNNYAGGNPGLYTLTAPTFAAISRSLTFSPGKTQLSIARGRSFITNDVAPVVVDRRYNDPSVDTRGPFARPAGLPPVQLTIMAFEPGPAAVDVDGLATRDTTTDYPWVAYKAVLRWSDPYDPSYVIRGAVSNVYAGKSTVKSGVPCHLRVVWPRGTYISAAGLTTNFIGTVVEFYRTEYQTDFDLLGDTYRYAFEYPIGLGDYVNGYADAYDTAYETGADIYLTEDGATKSNMPPPPSSDVVTYKGATFYTSTSLWHSFNTRINWWNSNYRTLDTADEKTYGIGRRLVFVKTTAGSPILDVSPTDPVTGAPSLNGVVVGQTFQHMYLPATPVPTITGVDKATNKITVSSPATTTQATAVGGYATDLIFINNVPLSLSTRSSFAGDLMGAQINGLPVVCLTDPALYGFQDATTQPSAQVLSFISPVSGTGSFTVRATNGQNYSPAILTTKTSDNDARTNRVHYSKIEQPEAVPVDNFFLVGNGTLLKLMVAQDMLVGFATDGIYRINGDGDDWSQTLLDRDTTLLAPDAASSMDGVIYAWTTAGFISLSDGEGIKKISAPLIGEDVRTLRKMLEQLPDTPPFTWNAKVICDKHKNEVWFSYTDPDDAAACVNYIWNTETSTFVTANSIVATAMTYSSFLQSPIFFIGDTLWQYDMIYGAYMPASVVFNALAGDDAGYLKQWVDVTLLLEDLSFTMNFRPSFESDLYPAPYPVYPEVGPFEHVVPVLQNYNYNKHCKFGFTADGLRVYWRLKGLAYRYRLASETMRQ